jgi:putative adenylate-forming enzyme
MNLSFKYLVIWYSIKTFIGRVIFEYSPKLIQDYRWRKLKRNHLSASPFYSSYVNSKAKLKDYPQIDKSIFMDNFDEINTRGIELMEATRVVLKAEKNRDFSPEINHLTVGLSTGTSGNKGVFLASQKERAIWVATILNRVIGWSLKKRKVAFFLRANSNLYESVGSSILSFNYFDILEPIESHIHRLNTLQPNIIVAQPSLLCLLSKSRFNNTLNINPTKIISVAEVLTPSDKKYIEDAFNQRIHQVYQCTEGFLAFTCKKGTLHMNEDFIHIEKHYIDHERFNPIITDLIRGTQPVIRYLLNDILIQGDKCDCGSNLMTLKLMG